MKAAIHTASISPRLSQFEATYGVVKEIGRTTTTTATTTTATANDVQSFAPRL